MTLVMARQFEDRVIVLSDSMITDRDATKPNIIPGELKTVVLNADVMVSYAGLLRPALEVIRRLRAGLAKNTNIQMVLETLCGETQKLKGEVDFLVGCLVPYPALYKIGNGKIYSGSDRYWIGDPIGASEVQKLLDIEPAVRVQDGMYYSAAEVTFALAFYDLVLERRVPGIGGVAFNCLGSSLGFAIKITQAFLATPPSKFRKHPKNSVPGLR